MRGSSLPPFFFPHIYDSSLRNNVSLEVALLTFLGINNNENKGWKFVEDIIDVENASRM